MKKVEFFTRVGCCLCDDALAVVNRVRDDITFELIEHDIEKDPELHRSYFDRIPVVQIDGQEQFEYFVSEARLRELVA